ncbi:MAG: hypothetical protein HY064_05605 [Bacteroidetes bacterium]|nr:hypothetical protein [Bacteroidota bacterium]
MKNHGRFLALFFLVSLFSCKRDPLTGDKSILTGTWNWHRSDLYETNSQGNYFIYDTDSLGGALGTTSQITFLERGEVSVSGPRQTTRSSRRITFNSFEHNSTDNSYTFDIKIYNGHDVHHLSGTLLDRSTDTLLVNEIPYPVSGNYTKTVNIYTK